MKLSLLMIGNSFADDTVFYLRELCQIYNIELEVGVLYIGGCSLDTHYYNAINNNDNYEFRMITNNEYNNYKNFSLLKALKLKKWEYITFQQASYDSGIKESYKHLNKLINYVKNNSNAKLGWNNTWAYSKDSNHSEYYRYNNNQEEMYNKIISVIKDVIIINEELSFIIPCGIAIQNMRKLTNKDNLTRDGFHLNHLGCFIAGLCMLKTINKIEINTIYLPNNETINNCIRAINDAFKIKGALMP